MTTIPLTPVRELHGSSVKAQLAQCLVPVHCAAPGDLVAVREVGLFEDNAPFVNARTFLLKTVAGYEECQLSDLPPGLRPAASSALGYIDNDWELLGDLADAAPEAFDEDHPDRWFEMIKFREGIGLLRLPEPCGMTQSVWRKARHTVRPILFAEAGVDGAAAASSPGETAAIMQAFSVIMTRRMGQCAELTSQV